MDYLTPIAAFVVAAAAVAYVVIRWLESSTEQRREYIYDLIEDAERLFSGEEGEKKLAYVLAEAEKAFPFLRSVTLRPIIEAAVKRLREREKWSDPKIVGDASDDPGADAIWN